MKNRMSDSSVWASRKFGRLPVFARLLLKGLPDLADDQGRLPGDPAYLRSQFFTYDDKVTAQEVRRWLGMIAETGVILLYEADEEEYIQIANWWETQSLQYAAPSDYPPPDHWQDHIRYNSKGGRVLTCSWTSANGEAVMDTCDSRGKPLPIVAQLPPRNPGGRPRKNSPENPGGNHAGNPPGNPPGFPPEIPGGNPNKDQINTIEDQEKEEGESNGAEAPAPPSSLKDHATINAYHDLYKLYPTKAQMALIIEHDPPISDWVRAIRAWALAGHKPTNIQGMLDWTFEPSRFAEHRGPDNSKQEKKRDYLPEEYSDIILGGGYRP